MTESIEHHELHQGIYLLLATLFKAPPQSECLQFLSELDISEEHSAMGTAWRELCAAAERTDTQSVAEEYQQLFIGIGLGEAVPYASWHMAGALMEKPLMHIRQDLSQLGMHREAGVKEPEDHIAALCEVMAELVQRPEPAQQMFFNQHIGPWYESLLNQISGAEHARFYQAVSTLCRTFFSIEQTRLSERSAYREDGHNKYGSDIEVRIVNECASDGREI